VASLHTKIWWERSKRVRDRSSWLLYINREKQKNHSKKHWIKKLNKFKKKVMVMICLQSKLKQR